MTLAAAAKTRLAGSVRGEEKLSLLLIANHILYSLPENGIFLLGAEAYGFRGEVWTCGWIGAVMYLELGVSSHPVPVGRLLKALRWSPLKPARRVRQRDETAITRWREGTWPALNQGAPAQGQTILFIDESGVSPLPRVVRTDAPVGPTPMLQEW